MGKKNERTVADAEPELNAINGHGNDSQNAKKLKKKEKNTEKEKVKDQDEASKKIPTVSIAVPASIIDNVPTLDLATRLAGQIARAATIFRINEVVVFDNKGNPDEDAKVDNSDDESSAAFLIRVFEKGSLPNAQQPKICARHSQPNT